MFVTASKSAVGRAVGRNQMFSAEKSPAAARVVRIDQLTTGGISIAFVRSRPALLSIAPAATTMHANKHARPGSSSEESESSSRTAAADKTQLLSDDIMNMVFSYASCRELCLLGRVCRRFSPLPFHDGLWELRALDVLPSVSHLRAAMAELTLTTCRELVETFTRIGIPGGILGFWQMDLDSHPLLPDGSAHHPHSRPLDLGCSAEEHEVESRGELLRISLESGGFLCESIEPNGSRER